MCQKKLAIMNGKNKRVESENFAVFPVEVTK